MQKRIPRDMFYDAKPAIFENAKYLRENMTAAEKTLWNRLKNNKLGVRFKSQHPVDIFIADFYCHRFKLVVEIDGKIHNNTKEYDEGRTAELEKPGIKVLRFTNEDVIENINFVLEKIKESCEEHP